MPKQEEQKWAARALVLACMTIAMTILVVIVEKTPLGMVLLLLAFLAYTVYPIIYLTGFNNPLRRRERWAKIIITFAIVIAFAIGMGFLFWPLPRIRITKEEPYPYPPVSTQPITVNLYLRNDGRDARVEIAYQIFFVDYNPLTPKERGEMEEKLWDKFKQNPRAMPAMDIATAEETWTTLPGDVLSNDQITRLMANTNGASIYVMGQFRNTDLISEKNLDFCSLFQNRQGVLPRCVQHNGISKD
jgi:hypothetical protein